MRPFALHGLTSYFTICLARENKLLLGHALSGRTIRRRAKSTGSRRKRRPPANNTRVHKDDMSDLIEATSNGFDTFNGHTLQFFIIFRHDSISHPVTRVQGGEEAVAAETLSHHVLPAANKFCHPHKILRKTLQEMPGK
jgi:hypothetical protein